MFKVSPMYSQTTLFTSAILPEALWDPLNELVIENFFFSLPPSAVSAVNQTMPAFPGVFPGVLISAPVHVLIIYSRKPGL